MRMNDDEVKMLLARRLHAPTRSELVRHSITLEPAVDQHLDAMLRELVHEWARPEDQEYWLGSAFEHLRAVAIEIALLDWIGNPADRRPDPA